MRVIIWVVSLLAAGVSFPKLLIDDGWRRRNFLKDGVPEVDDSYERVRAPGRTYHDLKNVAIESTRNEIARGFGRMVDVLALTGPEKD